MIPTIDKKGFLEYLKKMRKVQNDNVIRYSENVKFHRKNRDELDRRIKKLIKEQK